jgi:PEP-CTERM motif
MFTVRRLLTVCALVCAGAISPVAASADTLSPGTIVNVHFNGVGVPYSIGIHDGGPMNPFQGTIFADPYSLSANSGAGFLAMCFDADAKMAPPMDWRALVATSSDVAQYYYGGDTQKAFMIAYLNTLWPSADRATQAFVGAAMWEVQADFVDSTPASLNVTSNHGLFWLLDSGAATATQSLLNNAYDQVVNKGWKPGSDSLYLLPVSASGSTAMAGAQQYHDSPLYFTIDRTIQPFATNVPEPAMLILLLLGLAACALAHRRQTVREIFYPARKRCVARRANFM